MIRHGFPKVPFQILFFPLIFGLIQIYMGNNELFLFFKIFGATFFLVSFYYYVLHAFNLDVDYLFSLYMKGAYFVTIIGLIQTISFYANFGLGYDYSWFFNKWMAVVDKEGTFRMNSIFPEASQYAIVLAPAGFVAIHNLLLRKEIYINKYQSLAIIIGMILTTSSLAFNAIFISIALLTLNYGKFINFLIAMIALVFLVNLAYIYSYDFRSRVDSAYGLWIDNELSIDNVNNSSFVLYNNYHVALENIRAGTLNFFFGTGLGSHPLAFDKYSITNASDIIDFNNNRLDGNSMFVRLLSETGITGVFFMLYFLFKFYTKRNFAYMESNYWIISNGLFILIFLYFLRQGNYFINGFPFFMWMYYYTYKKNIEKKVDLEIQSS